MQARRFFCSLLCFLLGGTSTSFADSFFVENATGPGVSDADLAATTELVRAAVQASQTHQLVSNPALSEFSLHPAVLRIGHAYIIQLEKLKGGKTVFSTELKANQIEELDKVTKRLVEAVLDEKKAGEEAQLGEITQTEQQGGKERKPSRRIHSLAFGGSLFSQMNASSIGYSLGGAFGWDLVDTILKIQADLSLCGAALFFNADLETMFLLSRRETAPYLAGAFGFGVTRSAATDTVSSQTVAGFDIGAGGGLLFLRTSDVNLDIGLRFHLLLSANSQGNPLASTLRLGMYF